MSRRVKCQVCGELGTNDIFYKITENKKNKYFCNEVEAKQYIENERKRKELNELRSEALTYIHDEVLELQEGELIDTYIIKRTSELSKFYPWQVIKGCFKMKRNTIQHTIYNMEFKSSYHQAKYIMAIIESCINDVNGIWKHRKQQEQISNRINENVHVDLYNEVSISKINVRKENKKDISMFLDEEDE